MPVTSGCIYSRGSTLGINRVRAYNSNITSTGVTYYIDAKLMGPEYIDDEGDYQYVSISATSGQTVPLVTGMSGRKIEVQNYTLSASGATAVSFVSSGTTETIICGPMTMAANGEITNSGKSMITVDGDTLLVRSSLSTVKGSLAYRLV